VQQSLDQVIAAAIGQAERHQEPQGVSLLGRVRAVPTAHDRHTGVTVNGRLRGDLHIPVVRLVQPLAEYLLTHWVQRLVTRRVTEVGERAEYPVRTLPLGVGAGTLPRAERGQQPRHDRRAANLLPQCRDLRSADRLAQHPGANLPADGGLR
jgi:hypothetical protein